MTDEERRNFKAHGKIKMMLGLKGISLAEIGRRAGVTRATVSLVGLRKLKHTKVEECIAEALGVSVQGLFYADEPEKTKLSP